MSKQSPPSEFFNDQLPEIRAASRLGVVVDLACGRGRHTLATAAAGIPIIGIDRNRTFLTELREAATQRRLPVETIRADLENPAEIPLRSQCCGAVSVFRYLHRPLIPAIERILAPGGLLIYETFTIHQRTLEIGPSNPDYLLKPNELPKLFSNLKILNYSEDRSNDPKQTNLAHLIAQRINE
jgi:tellurite methyltransferase